MKFASLGQRAAGLLSTLMLLYGVSAFAAVDDHAAKVKNKLTDLPKHIHVVRGRLSLVADFQNKTNGVVMIYLINATKASVDLSSEGDDLFCKRVVSSEDGEWRRCDTHEYQHGVCGVGYASRQLPANEFFAWRQRCDSPKGDKRKMRFRLFQDAPFDLESNEGTGIADDAEIKFCRYDALAMSHGPFEDVAAVVTGKVQGGQGAGIPMVSLASAIRGLARFPNDERLLPVVKKVMTRLRNEGAANGESSYKACLDVLARTGLVQSNSDECWNYIADQVRDPKFPWSKDSLGWLISYFDPKEVELSPLVESVLSAPGHAAMPAAISNYGKVVAKQVAGQRLDLLCKDRAYTQTERNLAFEAREKLFVNPFLVMEAVSDNARTEGVKLLPLKLVSISNTSPQEIILPVASPEELLIVSLTAANYPVIRMGATGNKKSGSIRLKPGEKIELHNVRWWEHLNAGEIQKDRHYLVGFQAASPGLWDVPTAVSWWWPIEGAELLEAIQFSKNK